MPRPPRQSAPGLPMHIVQRGVNQHRCFTRSTDRHAFLRALATSSKKYDVHVHAYALMTNHVHLLATPWQKDGASHMMQQLGRQYVQYFNKAYDRSGPLWDGRFRSSLIQNDRYLLACYRYIELNPVRAGIVSSPEEYPWTSYRANALGETNRLLQPHGLLLELGASPEARRTNYALLFSHRGAPEMDEKIRLACRKNMPVR